MGVLMAEHSQNGWAVLRDDQGVWFTAAGERFAAANTDVAVVAKHLIERFNAEVEPIHGRVLDDWSRAVRPERGSLTVITNHASNTAWDLNALSHPRGKHGTFSHVKTVAVQRILESITDHSGDQVLRWGAGFRVVDSMHFEICTGEREVHQAALKIQALEDEVTPAEIVAALTPVIRAAIRAEILSVLETEHIVPNLPQTPDGKPLAYWTPVDVLAAGDKKADRALDAIAALAEQVKALSGTVAVLAARKS